MNDINVPNTADTSESILSDLADGLDGLSPQLRKAAGYILKNPNDVGVSSIREISNAADVTPNTIVRLAKSIGLEGYDELRAPFRTEIRKGTISFPDRARWLQSLSQSGQLGHLYADMVQSAISNIETTFSKIDTDMLTRAADAIWRSRHVFTLGVGINNSNARNFTYLAGTGMVQFHAIPRAGSTATDDLAWADKRDVLIAITCAPYRSEVVTATKIAKEQDVTVIALSDSAASPIARIADHSFQLATETPQFFPSSISTIALLETLLSFVIARSDAKIVTRVEAFHNRRHDLGIYLDD